MTVDINSLSNLPHIYNQQYTKEVADSIQRIDTGLKINETADDSASAILAVSLRANSSSLVQGIENINSGYGLIEVSNSSLKYQEEILNEIKNNLVSTENQNNNGLDAIRINIQSLIEEFDHIASSTSYNNRYTLQQSDSDTGASAQYSITLTENTSISTPSIQSNSEGVDLERLRSLSFGELTLDEANSQLDTIETALQTLSEFKDEFSLTKEELEIASSNLTTIEKGHRQSQQQLTQADISKEQGIFDKYRLLVDTSKYSLAQANLSQERVLDLLTNIPTYEPSSKDNESKTNGENTYNNDKQSSFDFATYDSNAQSTASTSSSSSNNSIE